MIVDGKKLAEEIKISLKNEVVKLGKKIRLAVVYVGKNAVTEKFLEQKKKFGGAVGIDVRVYNLPEDISTNKLRKKLAEVVHIKNNTGVIVQLPLPKQIKTQYILDGIIPEKDPDMLSSKSFGLFSSGRSKIFPPIVGAVDHVFTAYGVQLKAAKVVVLGAGRLVGRPIAIWLISQGSAATVIDENTTDPTLHTLNADIIISGMGMPHLITKDMVKDSAVVIDCGASEAKGKIAGDIDPAVAEKALLFAPVPGGIGPIVVAMLFKNLMELGKR